MVSREPAPPIIAVCGAGSCGPEVAARAEAVGQAIARAGATLICGGLGGVMEAAARGAAETGGLTVGILPGSDVADANPWIKVPVATGVGPARNVIIVTTAHAVIAVAGSFGTLSEIALALKLGRPVISLGSWEVSEKVVKADDAEQAVATALRLIGGGRN